MFTGLVEDVGEVERWVRSKAGGVLTVKTHLPLRETAVGSSIAVNGACLTVVKKGNGRFIADLSPETLARTTCGGLRPGDLVNLERPLRFTDRLGGHLLTGHIDGTGVIEQIEKRGDFTFFAFRVLDRVQPLIVPKGSIAVDGISLTVNECTGRRFSVAIIPFTFKNTNLRARRVGDRVNIEFDLIGKYVRSLLAAHRRRS